MKEIKGIYFNLNEIFSDLNISFFNNEISAILRWGTIKKNFDFKKRSIRLGSYQHDTKTITIHPNLDRAIVPQIILERIIFHEMAHQKFPIKKGPNGKNLIHYKEFYDFEKTYPYLAQADLWLKANLNKLLN